MVGVDAVILECLLDGDSDRRASAPDCHQECRLEAAAHNAHRQLHGITKQRFRGNEDLLDRSRGCARCAHGYSRTPKTMAWSLTHLCPSGVTMRRVPGGDRVSRNIEIKAHVASIAALVPQVQAVADQGPFEI